MSTSTKQESNTEAYHVNDQMFRDSETKDGI